MVFVSPNWSTSGHRPITAASTLLFQVLRPSHLILGDLLQGAFELIGCTFIVLVQAITTEYFNTTVWVYDVKVHIVMMVPVHFSFQTLFHCCCP